VYRGLDRPLADLGSRALVAVPVSALLAVGLYLVSHLGAGAQVRPEQGRRAKGRARRLVAGLAPRIGARDPVSRATFVFTLQTLARSTRHRLYVAGALAAGCALLVAVNAPDLAREGLAALRLPTPQLLAIQFVLAVCLLIALRAVFTVPAALRANWIFRLTENAAHRPATAGARRAAAAVVLLLLAVLFPAHLLMWGARVALLHFTAGLLASLAVAAALFSGFRKIPFTCSSVPGKSSVRLAWPIYVLLFLAGTFGLAAVERVALETPTGSALLLGILFVILILLGIRGRWKAAAARSLVFFEEPDRTQALGLTE